MARRIICILLVQSFVCKVLSIYAQPAIQQYLHLTGTPQSTQTITIPATKHIAPQPNVAPTNQLRPATGVPAFAALALPELISRIQQLQAVEQAAQTSNQVVNPPRPATGLSSFSALGLPNLVSSLQQLPTPKRSEVKPATSSSIDSNVLNNLAIALQLLIVSNILNTPPPSDSSSAKPVKETLACSELSPYSQSQPAMPNSNFVGSSGFAEPNLAQVHKPTRNSMSLLSPYEALGPISPYSEPKLSQYGPSNPRQDFQSPYAMMTDRDMFSMNDLF